VRLRAAEEGEKVSEKPYTNGAVPTLAANFSQLSALPDTAEEIKEIADALHADTATSVYIGRLATESTVKRLRLDNRRVIVFATHGIAAGELIGLDQPALVLSNPALTGEKDEDGFLTMEEVLGLKLDADWVVLSACNTASADGKGSEAVSGLGRAFFYAGARSLLVSNWAVETTSARLLTTELFKQQSANSNLSRAEALRQAMLSLIAKDRVDLVDMQPGLSYAHPAFWAPFSLVGDSR
jgi:CHAT domain-containing protein